MKRQAQKLIYRNLTSKCFSVRVRGKVVQHFTEPCMIVGGFKVNEGTRDRVRAEKKKYVHAFITAPERFELVPYKEKEWEGYVKREVVYNPHKNDTFVYADTGDEADGSIIVMIYPKVYTLRYGGE